MLKFFLFMGVSGIILGILGLSYLDYLEGRRPKYKEYLIAGGSCGIFFLIGWLIAVGIIYLVVPFTSAKAEELNSKILIYLNAVGCKPPNEVIQSIKVDPNHRFYGSYSDGQIIVRSLDDERTLVHELYHSCQKKATNYNEWWLNEIEAKGIEMKWVNQGK